MTIINITLIECNSKERCVNPLGSWLPATTEHFSPDHRKSSGLCGKCRICRREKAKQVRHDNPERFRAYDRKKRLEHNADFRAYDRARYRKNKAAKNAQSRAYRERNHEQVLIKKREYDKSEQGRATKRNWSLTHTDSVKASRKRTYAKHSLKYKVSARNRKLRARNAQGKHSADDIQLLLRSQKRRCWWCGEKIKGDDYHVDHRIPLIRGGSNAPENLCIACSTCNLSKGAKLPQEWNGRLL